MKQLSHFLQVITTAVALLVFQTVVAEAGKQNLYLSATQAIKQTAREGNSILIDVRLPRAYELVSIPHSMNMPLFAIKTKPFLRGRQVILVSDGFPDRKLEETAQDLSRWGFRVWILKGGIAAWHLHGGVLRGDMFALGNQRRISVERFHREMDHPGLMILDLSDPGIARPQAMTAASVRLAITTDQSGGPSHIGQTGIKRKSIQIVLVVGETGGEYDAAAQIIEPTIQKPVFYLEGGMMAYREYVKNLKHANRSPDERLVRISECKPCREADNVDKQ